MIITSLVFHRQTNLFLDVRFVTTTSVYKYQLTWSIFFSLESWFSLAAYLSSEETGLKSPHISLGEYQNYFSISTYCIRKQTWACEFLSLSSACDSFSCKFLISADDDSPEEERFCRNWNVSEFMLKFANSMYPMLQMRSSRAYSMQYTCQNLTILYWRNLTSTSFATKIHRYCGSYHCTCYK